jgi:hypothetical protein
MIKAPNVPKTAINILHNICKKNANIIRSTRIGIRYPVSVGAPLSTMSSCVISSERIYWAGEKDNGISFSGI